MTIRLFCRPNDIEDKAFFVVMFTMGSVILGLGLFLIISIPMDKGVSIPLKVIGVFLSFCAYGIYHLAFSFLEINIFPFGWKKCKD